MFVTALMYVKISLALILKTYFLKFFDSCVNINLLLAIVLRHNHSLSTQNRFLENLLGRFWKSRDKKEPERTHFSVRVCFDRYTVLSAVQIQRPNRHSESDVTNSHVLTSVISSVPGLRKSKRNTGSKISIFALGNLLVLSFFCIINKKFPVHKWKLEDLIGFTSFFIL